MALKCRDVRDTAILYQMRFDNSNPCRFLTYLS